MKHRPTRRYFNPARFLTGVTMLVIGSICLSAEPQRPNIILVMADDQGWGQVGYNGHPHLKTPHLDDMAEKGLRFDRFYAASPVCSPTRASVLTGRIPARTGVPGLHKRLCLQEKTLSQALKNAGYRTAHFGKWHLGGVKGSSVPVLPDDPNHPGHYGFDHWVSATNYIEMDPLMSRNGEFVALKGDSSILMVEEAIEFIKADKDSPFFALIWYGSPHWPYDALSQDKEGLPSNMDGDLKELLGEIVGMDRSIGLLRSSLKEMGLADSTLIWYCSDNGGRDHDPDASGGLRDYKGTLYEGGIRVPGIIEWPAVIKPQVTDVPASTMDIMPTIVDLLDLPEDAMLPVDGQSILPLFAGKTIERANPMTFIKGGTAVIDGDFKFVQEGRGKKAIWRMYDLVNDPAETTDIAQEYPERLAAIQSFAKEVDQSVKASAKGKDYPEGRVIQPQRGDHWEKMPEYQQHFETFKRLDPTFEL